MQIELSTEDIAKDAYNSAIQKYGSSKDKMYEKVKGTRDTLSDAGGYMKENCKTLS